MKKLLERNKKSLSNGFTLIELLVVIFIIGVLVSLLLANILGARQRAEDVERKSDLQQMKRALRLYYNDNQSYPGVIPAAGIEFNDGGSTIYMKEVPEYKDYGVSGDGERFALTIELDNASDQSITDSQTRCGSSLTAASVTADTNDYVVCED